MVTDILTVLVRLSVVGTLGILVVGPLRVLARRMVGTEAAYWLWLLLPASLVAVLLPRAPSCLCGPETHVAPLLIRGISAPLEVVPSTVVNDFTPTATLVWVIGVAVALVYLAYAQRTLRRSLGTVEDLPGGTYRSSATKQPMVVGVWHPHIVLPGDFETRYSPSEQALVLAHERAHLGRHDALANFLAVGLVCLFWFNPLMYWGWSCFRFDQEAACDAAVIRRSTIARRRYAWALAKTQIAGPIAIAFGWRRRHPLLARIAILGRPVPNRARRLTGYSLALVLTFCGTYVVWAAPPDSTAPSVDANPCIDTSLEPCKIAPYFGDAEVGPMTASVARVSNKKFITYRPPSVLHPGPSR